MINEVISYMVEDGKSLKIGKLKKNFLIKKLKRI